MLVWNYQSMKRERTEIQRSEFNIQNSFALTEFTKWEKLGEQNPSVDLTKQ